MQARGHFVTLRGEGPQGEGQHTIVEGTRSLLSRTPAQIRYGPPTLGRDNQQVLEKVLGYDTDRITELVIAGVLE